MLQRRILPWHAMDWNTFVPCCCATISLGDGTIIFQWKFRWRTSGIQTFVHPKVAESRIAKSRGAESRVVESRVAQSC